MVLVIEVKNILHIVAMCVKSLLLICIMKTFDVQVNSNTFLDRAKISFSFLRTSHLFYPCTL
jgi:hypothetical protein